MFLIYNEIQIRAVAKSYLRKGFLKYEEMRKYLAICEEAVSVYYFANGAFWISLYMKKILFSFLSVNIRFLFQSTSSSIVKISSSKILIA